MTSDASAPYKLSRREATALLGAAPLVIGATAPALRLPKAIAGVTIPDTKFCQSAAELAFSASPAFLYNHCMRTFVFAAAVYDKAETRYDSELVFAASILHDLGLVPEFMSPNERFEVDSANAADAFMRKHDIAKERRDIVWEAIYLHTGGRALAARRGSEVAAVGIGAAMDIGGLGLAGLPSDRIRQLLSEYPRLGFKRSMVEALVDLCRRKPMAQVGQFTAEIGRAHIHDFKCPTFEQLIMRAPFEE